METNTKLLLAAGLLLSGWHYLLSGYPSAGCFLLLTDALFLTVMMLNKKQRRFDQAVLAGMVSLILGELLLLCQPPSLISAWQPAVLLNAWISAALSGWFSGFGQRAKAELSWRLDWCLLAGVILCSVTAMLPLSVMRYLMNPVYQNLTRSLPVILIPPLIFLPLAAARLLLGAEAVRRRDNHSSKITKASENLTI